MNHLIRNALTCLATSQFRLDRVGLEVLACVAIAFIAAAEAPDPRNIFAPLTSPNQTPTRSVSGIPGPAYWQNRADYTIAARIDPAMSRPNRARDDYLRQQ